MEAKDIERHKKELLQVGNLINDFGTTFALHSHNKRHSLLDICKVTEDIFEISFKAGIKEVVEWGEEECFEHPFESDQPDEEYNRKRHRCPQCWEAKLKEWGV